MPMSIPRVRPVARSAETVPVCSLTVWRNAIVEFGERKRDRPMPKQARRSATENGVVWMDRVVNRNRPVVQTARPVVAMILASVLSASHPAMGAVMSAVMGMASITMPILELEVCSTIFR